MSNRSFGLVALVLLGAALGAGAATRFVNVSNTAPESPYATWAGAATRIQDAADVAVTGDLILVTNGLYDTGGRVVSGAMMNRVAVTKAVTVRSVNGPGVTTICGYQDPTGPDGDAAIRCVYLAGGALLSGFTLTNGATRSSGDLSNEQAGGGVWCSSATAIVSNCVVTGNSAYDHGAGVVGGTLKHCLLTNNTAGGTNLAVGGGAYGAVLNDCTLADNGSFYGGGAYDCTLTRCTLVGNEATYWGGGAFSGTLNQCTLRGNSVSFGGGGGAYWCSLTNCTLTGNGVQGGSGGGGAYDSTLDNCVLSGNYVNAGNGGGAASAYLNNCALAGNQAIRGGGTYACALKSCTLSGNFASEDGGGDYDSLLTNCIVYYNSAFMLSGSNWSRSAGSGAAAHYCCTLPLPPGGAGNLTNAPVFVNLANGNLRLQSNSPCINRGDNAYAVGTTDCDGRPRIVNATVDLGAYEFQVPGLAEYLGWLQQYGLATDGSADYVDSDTDGLNNSQEWLCLTDPTNALSVLRMVSASPAGAQVRVRWQSVAGVTYHLLRSTNLWAWPPFQLLVTNLVGQAGTTLYTDIQAAHLAPLYYRVGVGNYVAPTSPPPPTLTWRLNPGARTLELSWSGVGFRLQTQNNSVGVGLSTNWFDYPGGGSSPVTIPVGPAGHAAFYRLVWP